MITIRDCKAVGLVFGDWPPLLEYNKRAWKFSKTVVVDGETKAIYRPYIDMGLGRIGSRSYGMADELHIMQGE